jgi:hypothetical protein
MQQETRCRMKFNASDVICSKCRSTSKRSKNGAMRVKTVWLDQSSPRRNLQRKHKGWKNFTRRRLQNRRRKSTGCWVVKRSIKLTFVEETSNLRGCKRGWIPSVQRGRVARHVPNCMDLRSPCSILLLEVEEECWGMEGRNGVERMEPYAIIHLP